MARGNMTPAHPARHYAGSVMTLEVASPAAAEPGAASARQGAAPARQSVDRQRAGHMLWLALVCLNVAARHGVEVALIGPVLATAEPTINAEGVKVLCDILASTGLATVETRATGRQWATITPLGEAVACFRVPAPPGIGRA